MAGRSTEVRTIARHAGTVFVGQLAVTAFGLTDTLVAGRFSSQALAGLSVGAAVYISIFVGLMGVLQAQLPIWAHLRGAGRAAELGASVRQSLYLALMAMALGMWGLLHPDPLLRATEVPPYLEAEVRRYLFVLAFALPPALLFRLFSTLSQSLGKPLLVTWIQIGSLALKVPLTLWFMFGGLGLPSLGLPGAAWATLVVNYLMLALALGLLRGASVYRPYAIWQRLERPDWAAIRGFVRLGIPTGLAIMVEVTSFTLMALFIARLGTVAAASHQVAASLTGLLYMMPLALGIAASARASYWLGADNPQAARHAIGLGLRLALGWALLGAAGLLLFRHAIAQVYASNPAVVALAASLLPWVAAYHLADATQVVCVFLLRSFGIATATLVVYSVLLWGVGLGGGYWLAYVGLPGWVAPQPTPAAFWAAGAFALWLTALSFLALLWRAAREDRRP